jgi:tetratricopeptide (TPR) repeat protein
MNQPSQTFISELRRRRVLNIGAAYIAGAWLGAEVLSFLLEQAGAPAWSLRLLAIVLVVGFPVTVVLVWVIQVQPDGKWAADPFSGQRRTIFGAIVLGIVATAGLSWLILPNIEDATVVPAYQPIPNSVAILPLAAADATPNVRTISGTLYEALRAGLNQSRELTQVILTTEETPRDLVAYGKEFKVAALLAGRIVQAAGGLRIELELLDVGLEEVRWSSAFEWDSTRIREAGTEIANGVLDAMGLQSMSQDRFAGTDNGAAYEALLSGFGHQRSFQAEDQVLAIDEFQRAIDLDPEFVSAYIGLAQTIWIYLWKGPAEEERDAWKQRAYDAIDRSLQLDGNSADAISMAGMWEENRDLRLQAYRRALDLDPDHAMSYFRLGGEMWAQGKLEDAERLVRKALDFNPMSSNFSSDLGGILREQGRHEEAFAAVERSIALNPGMIQNYVKLASWSEGQPVEVIGYLRKAFDLDPANGYLASRISMAYAGLRASEETLAWAKHATALSPTNTWAWVLSMISLFSIGEHELAFQYADRALELDPGKRIVLRERGWREIEAGQTRLALQRWQEAYQLLTDRQNPQLVAGTAYAAVDFASNLVAAGEREWAQQVLNSGLDALEDFHLYLQWADHVADRQARPGSGVGTCPRDGAQRRTAACAGGGDRAVTSTNLIAVNRRTGPFLESPRIKIFFLMFHFIVILDTHLL